MNRRGFLTGLLATPVAMALAPVAIKLETLAPPLFEASTGIYNGVIIREWGKNIVRECYVSLVSPSQWVDLREAKADFSDDQDPWLDDEGDDG